MEAHLALHVLMARYPRARLAVAPGAVDWLPGILVRGLARLPVALGG
jgi:cytochrome P450